MRIKSRANKTGPGEAELKKSRMNRQPSGIHISFNEDAWAFRGQVLITRLPHAKRGTPTTIPRWATHYAISGE